VNKLIFFGAGAVGAASLALFGAGTAAAAPDVVGQTYEDASAAIEDDGGTPKIAVTVGSFLPQDECVVTNAWDVVFIRDDEGEFAHAADEVMLSLNCNGGHATHNNPGASAASSAGRQSSSAIQDAAEAAAPEGAVGETTTDGIPTIDGIPCTGRNIGRCLGLAQNAAE
jgi:hypothetical protein